MYKLLVASIISIMIVGCDVKPENELRVPASSGDFKGENYQEVIDDLQSAGFTNIEMDVLDDLITGWLTKDGEVEQVEIDGDSDFSKSTSYPKNVKIVITYHTFPSTETGEVPETTESSEETETPEAMEASGVSGGRNVSGFDTKTNQTITWCGIDFAFPYYYNVLDEGSTETWITYYPKEEDYYASILFQSQEFSGTEKDFQSQIPSIVDSTLDGDFFVTTEIQKSEEISIAGLPGWTITFSGSDTDGGGVITTGSYSFACNINTGKIVMITCIYDSNDQSQYDYLGDYKKVLETAKLSAEALDLNGVLYNIIQVDGGDLSGERKANVAVDIGFGEREYWAFTNEYGQLVYVTANIIIPQDDGSESVNADGRYYANEAKVPGTEHEDLDEGHVIADSLGGVSNAYNITPQDSTMNRYGDQAYMEKVIRDTGGCTDFEAIITCPDTQTQIPSHYHYTYTLNGNTITEDFDNVNPDTVNQSLAEGQPKPGTSDDDISSIDLNGNGKITIAEAKAAGYSMPIYSDHWLYKYMDDRDGDGMVGE